jgi:predicted MFS family arabinose efflux permease
MTTADPKPKAPPAALGLTALFGALYFVQGICEPGEGLIAQPVRSLLRDWGTSAGDIAQLTAVLGFPWMIKPLYGFLADFVPLGRARRRNWLIVGTLTTTVGLGYLFLHPPVEGQHRALLWSLLIPTIAVALTDVVTDSLMVEKGQPLGLTGRLQSAQWACMYAATMLTGSVGGWLSENKLQTLGFAICAAAAAVSLVLALTCVHEPERLEHEAKAGERLLAMGRAFVDGRFLAAAAFLFCWNFNPFSAAIQQDYQVMHLDLGDQFYGWTVTVSACGSVLACIAYGIYAPYVPVNLLIHLSIVSGIVTTLLFLGLHDAYTAVGIAAITGFSYMTGLLVQLDLAARVCPPLVAGTVFALLMSLSNFGTVAGQYVGGWLHNRFEPVVGPHVTFDRLVWLGSAASALCWLLYPWLKHAPEVPAEAEAGIDDPALPR